MYTASFIKNTLPIITLNIVCYRVFLWFTAGAWLAVTLTVIINCALIYNVRYRGMANSDHVFMLLTSTCIFNVGPMRA